VTDDLDEFTSFVASSSAALFRVAGLLTSGDAHAAQDLVQEAYSETYRRWSSIRDADARQAYARRILVRAATRRWQRLRVEHHEAQVHGRDVEVGHADRVTEARDLWVALGALSPKQRAVVVLRYYEDMTEAQIAEVLNCSPGAVKSHASRGLRTLQERLGGPAYLKPALDGSPDDAVN
jgi:RNA polymerase sigma-70 factor (sigma-E family)